MIHYDIDCEKVTIDQRQPGCVRVGLVNPDMSQLIALASDELNEREATIASKEKILRTKWGEAREERKVLTKAINHINDGNDDKALEAIKAHLGIV